MTVADVGARISVVAVPGSGELRIAVVAEAVQHSTLRSNRTRSLQQSQRQPWQLLDDSIG
jgi:hypothetical protein